MFAKQCHGMSQGMEYWNTPFGLEGMNGKNGWNGEAKTKTLCGKNKPQPASMHVAAIWSHLLFMCKKSCNVCTIHYYQMWILDNIEPMVLQKLLQTLE